MASEDATERAGSDAGWIAALWLAAALFFWPVLFGGQVFYFRDVTAYHYPQASLTSQALLEGRIPHWEPRIGTGYPYSADPHSLIGYPLTVLLLLLPFPFAFSLFTAAHVPICGTFVYFLLRGWSLPRPAAAAGAIAAMFSGFSISVLYLSPDQHGLAWAPAALLAYDRFLATGSRAFLAWTALALAVQCSGSDPQCVLFTAVLLGLLPAVRGRTSPRILAALAASVAYALALAAYQYLPLAQFAGLSMRAGGMELSGPFTYDLRPANMPGFILPVAFPDPATPFFKFSYADALVPLLVNIYWGVPMLMLAVAALGWSERLQRRLAIGGWAVALVSVALALGRHAPFFPLLTAIFPPLLSFRFTEKYLFVPALVVPVLAALGVAGLARGLRGCYAWGAAFAGCSAALALAGFAAVTSSGLALEAGYAREGLRHMKDPGRFLAAMHGAWSSNLAFAAAASICLAMVCWLVLRGKLVPERAAVLLAALAVLDLTFEARTSCIVTSAEFVTTVPQAATMLPAAKPGEPPPRYATVEPIYTPASDDWTVFDSTLYKREMLKTLRAAPLGLNPLHETGAIPLRDYGALQRMLTTGDAPSRLAAATAAGARFTVWTGDGATVRLARHPQASPRAFVARRASRWQGPAANEPLPIARFPEEALFESETLPSSLAPSAVRKCELRDYRADSLRIDVDVSGSGLLVVVDAHYPGWRAFVDGAERPIARVAGHFRGVEVREGDRSVEMRFEPRLFRTGAWITLLALLGGAAWALYGFKIRWLSGAHS